MENVPKVTQLVHKWWSLDVAPVIWLQSPRSEPLAPSPHAIPSRVSRQRGTNWIWEQGEGGKRDLNQ